MERGPTYGPPENPNRAVELSEQEVWNILERVASASIDRAEDECKGITNHIIPVKNFIAHDANMWLNFVELWENDQKRRYAVRDGKMVRFILDGTSELNPMDYIEAADEARKGQWDTPNEGEDPPQDSEDLDPDEILD